MVVSHTEWLFIVQIHATDEQLVTSISVWSQMHTTDFNYSPLSSCQLISQVIGRRHGVNHCSTYTSMRPVNAMHRLTSWIRKKAISTKTSKTITNLLYHVFCSTTGKKWKWDPHKKIIKSSEDVAKDLWNNVTVAQHGIIWYEYLYSLPMTITVQEHNFHQVPVRLHSTISALCTFWYSVSTDSKLGKRKS